MIAVLVVEDNPGDARLAQISLAEGRDFCVDLVASVGAAEQRLAQHNYDCILTDLSLPDAVGAATLSRLRAVGADVPLVVLSGYDDDAFSVEAVRSGVQDYLIKGEFSSSLLRRTLRHAVERHALEARVRQSEARQRKILEVAPEAIFIVNSDGRLEECNPTAVRTFCLPDGWAGMPLDAILSMPGGADTDGQWCDGEGQAGGRVFPIEVCAAVLGDGGGRLVVVRDMTAHKHLEDRLRALASTDGLTGLLNRRGFVEAMTAEQARQRRTCRPLAAIALDLDHFKTVNDTWGHATGDEVLRGLADVFRRELRDIDIAGRTGGEEFCVLLPGATLELAFEVGERLCRAVAAQPFVIPGAVLNMTISAGVASVAADELGDAALERADSALYRAKQSGRNRVVAEGSACAC